MEARKSIELLKYCSDFIKECNKVVREKYNYDCGFEDITDEEFKEICKNINLEYSEETVSILFDCYHTAIMAGDPDFGCIEHFCSVTSNCNDLDRENLFIFFINCISGTNFEESEENRKIIREKGTLKNIDTRAVISNTLKDLRYYKENLT